MSFSSPSSTSRRSSIPRPPGTSSPLRPTSPTQTTAIAGTRIQSHSSTRVNSLSNSSQSPSAIRRASSGTLTHSQTDSSASSVTSVSATPQTRSKARDLLRKHYGLGVGPPPPTGKPHDPMDLDSQSFDAKAYYEQLITTSPLVTLLKKENELLSEIRSLDSDRQSLVYNHHHELIAASDTIAAMKSRAENLDAEMDSLKAAFSEISRLSTEVANDRNV